VTEDVTNGLMPMGHGKRISHLQVSNLVFRLGHAPSLPLIFEKMCDGLVHLAHKRKKSSIGRREEPVAWRFATGLIT
jgi:hypothetical protein